jgi:hypothetical protein
MTVVATSCLSNTSGQQMSGTSEVHICRPHVGAQEVNFCHSSHTESWNPIKNPEFRNNWYCRKTNSMTTNRQMERHFHRQTRRTHRPDELIKSTNPTNWTNFHAEKQFLHIPHDEFPRGEGNTTIVKNQCRYIFHIKKNAVHCNKQFKRATK